MLNYILPPIIIVISLSILIMFLFRKMQQVPVQELMEEQQRQKEKKWTSSLTSAMGQFGLKILEHFMHKSKLVSLKFHNVSNDWFHSIREKRQNHRVLAQQEMAEKDIQEAEKRERIVFEEITHRNGQQAQRPARPLVRETIARPQRSVKIKEKNQLEDALIRRIAVNPKDIEAYERLGDYYLESENFRDSHECFKQVLKLSPTHHKARLRLRRIERFLSQA